jgi:hypothetical protein
MSAPTPSFEWVEEPTIARVNYFHGGMIVGYVDLLEAGVNAFTLNAGEVENLGHYGTPEEAKATVEERVNDLLA